MKQVVPVPCTEYYRDTEWNVGLWGAYAFGGSDNDTERHFSFVDGETVDVNENILGDSAWGGGIDVKYFFHRYFGIGIEGNALSTDRGSFRFGPNLRSVGLRDDDGSDVVGSVLGTFTFRFPINRCSRFAPYIWGGVGVIFDGDHTHYELIGVQERFVRSTDDHTSVLGQVGGGFEVRLTKCIGWINDISWNFTDDDSFGMVRSGINFAF